MITPMNIFEQKNSQLITEFDRYVKLIRLKHAAVRTKDFETLTELEAFLQCR